MVTHALFCASRRNGVRGIAFNDFFSGLVGELQHEKFQRPKLQLLVKGRGKKKESYISIDANALLRRYTGEGGLKEKFERTKIPFLAPPNARWPDYIIAANGGSDDDCKFGHLFRAQNADRLDCYVMIPDDANPLFVCECKCWDKRLDGGTMKKIIAGLNAEYSGSQQQPKWNNWDLALVFCQELATFRKDTIKPSEFLSTGIVTVDCKTWVVKWILNPKAGKKLVIVLQTGSVL